MVLGPLADLLQYILHGKGACFSPFVELNRRDNTLSPGCMTACQPAAACDRGSRRTVSEGHQGTLGGGLGGGWGTPGVIIRSPHDTPLKIFVTPAGGRQDSIFRAAESPAVC